ncbi:MAG: hypothetical protein JST00_09795 [Deltaproteobacteria bacterium]|nr:hypothetical protein [Deltaproteobacteria bacterium]
MKEVKYEGARLWRAGFLAGGFGFVSAVAACAAPQTAVLPDSQTATALTTTTDLDAAQTCLETYVTCVRDGGAACKDELLACWQSAQVVSVDGSDAGVAPPARGDRDGGGRGTCQKKEKGDPAKAKGRREPPPGCVKKADSCAAAKKKTCAACADDAVGCVVDDANGTATDDGASSGDTTSTDGTGSSSSDTPADESASDPPADEASGDGSSSSDPT